MNMQQRLVDPHVELQLRGGRVLEATTSTPILASQFSIDRVCHTPWQLQFVKFSERQWTNKMHLKYNKDRRVMSLLDEVWLAGVETADSAGDKTDHS